MMSKICLRWKIMMSLTQILTWIMRSLIQSVGEVGKDQEG